jgi:hypothetical protein
MSEGTKIVGAVPAIASQRLRVFWRHRIPSYQLGFGRDNRRTLKLFGQLQINLAKRCSLGGLLLWCQTPNLQIMNWIFLNCGCRRRLGAIVVYSFLLFVECQ